MVGAEYVAGLPNRRPEQELRAYLDSASTTAIFELRRDLTRQAFAIKIIPYRATPILYAEPLTVDTKRRAFCDVFSVLARKEALVRYHWDTPAYRQLCAEMGLDPDEGRPRYREAFAGIVGELERWLGDVFTDGAEGSSPAYDTKAAAFDLLDLMRVDRPRDPTLLDALRRRWVRVDPGRMPRYSELEQLIETEALLLHGGELTSASNLATQVDFLPSRYGAGYSASIYGFIGQHEVDGWATDVYGGLRGVAVEPDQDPLREQTWLRVVVRRLRGQGVLFLTQPEANAYLTTDEATYWVWQDGGSLRWRCHARTPTHAERLRWRLSPPDLPLDRELEARNQRYLRI